jgi:predicted nucleic acid-binding protein
MNVLVDTCIWSLALRKNNVHEDQFVKELRELIKEFRVRMIGPIRQEVLSGIRSKSQFARLREHLRAFPDLEITISDYEKAAKFFNISCSKGIQGSNTDFLICAVAERQNMLVFTTDRDFMDFKKHIPIKLHTPRAMGD